MREHLGANHLCLTTHRLAVNQSVGVVISKHVSINNIFGSTVANLVGVRRAIQAGRTFIV